MKTLSRLLAAGAFLLLPAFAHAGAYEEGVKALERGDYPAALRQLRPLAQKGDPRAETNLGILYYLGRGVPQDDKEALKWLRKAAARGHSPAQHALGLMHAEGRGVTQDFAAAAQWYRKAADQGFAPAQNALGLMYEAGVGVDKDLGQAAGWYRKAAEQNDEHGLNNLGTLYAQGEGVELNHVLAFMLFNLAAAQGNETAIDNWRAVGARLSPEQLAEGERLAQAWQPGTPLPTRTASPAAAALPPPAEPAPQMQTLPCSAGKELKNTYTPFELYLSVTPCVEEKRYEEAANMFVLAGLYGRYDQQRVRDRSAHQAVTVLKTAVTPHFSDGFREYLSSLASGEQLAGLCATMRKVGRPDYYPSYMVNHGLASLTAQIEGMPQPEGALDEAFDPQAAWELALDQYLHCPR